MSLTPLESERWALRIARETHARADDDAQHASMPQELMQLFWESPFPAAVQDENFRLLQVNQAYADFSTVATRYPNSRYAADARQRMVFLRNEFARFERNTALYYLRRGAWIAANERATYLLETYPQSEYQNDAVAMLGESYTRLGNATLAADAKRVLQQNDPQHPWLAGRWPDESGFFRRLNPFAGDTK